MERTPATIRAYSRFRSTRTLVAGGIYLVVLVALWLVPVLLFPNPKPNEAIEFAAWGVPLLLTVPLATVVSLVLYRKRWPAALPIGLAVYLLGVAADMVLGLTAFGNFSNDQFLPLVLFPSPAGLAGFVTLVVVMVATRPLWPPLERGAVSGFIGAAVVGVWILMRGARDWLVAPYGFDIAVLIIVVAVAVVQVTMMAPGTQRKSGT